MSAKPKIRLSTPLSFNLGLAGLLLMTVPGLNGTCVSLFGWDRWPREVTMTLVGLGCCLAIIALILSFRTLRWRK
jgi:hypothetical protein